MNRRLFFKTMGRVGLAGLALKLTFADAGVRRIAPELVGEALGQNVQARTTYGLVETLTTGLNSTFYSVIDPDEGIRINVLAAKQVTRLTNVPAPLRKAAIQRVVSEIDRRRQYGQGGRS